MPRLPPLPALVLLVSAVGPLRAAELPSFLQVGDAFCTRESDFDDFAARGRARANSAIETCQTIDRPTRVAVMGGRAKQKSMVRVINGPYAYSVGWTNGALPLAR